MMKLTKKLKRKIKRRVGLVCAGITLVCVSVLTMEMTDVSSFGFADSIKHLVEQSEDVTTTEGEIVPSNETNIKGIKVNRLRI